MPQFQAFQPADSPPMPLVGAAAPLLAGLVGSAALIALAAVGKADVQAAGVAAVVLALIGGALSLTMAKPHLDRARTLLAGGESGPPASASRLEDEAHTYVSALELAPNPVMLVSAEEPDDLASRRIVFANAFARDLLRISREGALLVAALRNPDVLEAIDESLFGGLDRVVTYETGGPQSRFWRVSTNPLPSTPARPNLALVIMRDETDIRLNERMRADFLANASHELRTPLASLTGFIETLRGHARDDPAARERFLLIMSLQAERMARLIDDLLSLSRIELNEHIRPSSACDLALAVIDVVDALAPQTSAKQVSVEIKKPGRGECMLVGDRDQIVQVVQNLLDNAVKYSPPGGTVRVEVAGGLALDVAAASRPDSARLSSPDGGRMSLQTPTWAGAERYAVLRVVDDGPGMAREHLPRLTERFYRVEGQKSTGTGLGLAIVKHIVNRHRGGLFVESAPGKGSAFCVYLPMTWAAAASTQAELRPSERRGAESAAAGLQNSPEEIKLS